MALHIRRLLAVFSTLTLLCIFGCGGGKDHGGGDAPVIDDVTLERGSLTVHVGTDPLSVEMVNDGATVIRTSAVAFAAATRDVTVHAPFIEGYEHVTYDDGPWLGTARATGVRAEDSGSVTLRVETHGAGTDSEAAGPVLDVTVAIDGEDLVLSATSNDDAYPLVSLVLATGSDERFVGMGERENAVDHAGALLRDWTEEGGIGEGEDVVGGDANPWPHGPDMTHIPVPFAISSAGYGLWLDSTWRSTFDFGATDEGTLRIAADGGAVGVRVFTGAPREVLRKYTAVTGRAALPAPWVFGVRMRTGRSSTHRDVLEMEQYRAYDIPVTALDDATHFLPNASHLGAEDELRAWTDHAEELGFKSVCYFNPYVSATIDGANAYRDDGLTKKVFVDDAQGNPLKVAMISGTRQEAYTLDLTKPQAVAWYGDRLDEALDLGYDGFMLDFGEYLPLEARLNDGRTGAEAHNAYPLLVQEATMRHMRERRGNDYLYFVRSGYSGTQARTPMVWSGDPTASFADARGLPGTVRAGINAGLSGLPYWGSDIGGYTCAPDPVPDKEVFLRWSAFGALSPDMHVQTACAQGPEGASKWTVWGDQETTDAFRGFARLHTRLFPYIEANAKEATGDGMPIMRHPLLAHPELPQAWDVVHEYYFGDSLYVAPVIHRGETVREAWLPPGRWVDWWNGELTNGGAVVTRDAPLDEIPMWIKEGGIVPMLDASIDTLAVTSNPDVVDLDDVADVLDVVAVVGYAEPVASIALADGTVLTAEITDGQGIPRGGTDIVEVADDRLRVRYATDEDRWNFNGLVLTKDGGPPRTIRWDVRVLVRP